LCVFQGLLENCTPFNTEKIKIFIKLNINNLTNFFPVRIEALMIRSIKKRSTLIAIGVGLGVAGGIVTCSVSKARSYSTEQVEKAEQKLLSAHVKASYETFFVNLPSGVRMHTLKVHGDHDELISLQSEKPPLVLMHGWSSGLALWGKNIDELSEHFSIYAIDLLGFGRSDRPAFPRASRATPEQAKAFWLDSFHEWKQQIFGDQKIYLLGHSLVGI
jgi:hypothetical protein